MHEFPCALTIHFMVCAAASCHNSHQARLSHEAAFKKARSKLIEATNEHKSACDERHKPTWIRKARAEGRFDAAAAQLTHFRNCYLAGKQDTAGIEEYRTSVEQHYKQTQKQVSTIVGHGMSGFNIRNRGTGVPSFGEVGLPPSCTRYHNADGRFCGDGPYMS